MATDFAKTLGTAGLGVSNLFRQNLAARGGGLGNFLAAAPSAIHQQFQETGFADRIKQKTASGMPLQQAIMAAIGETGEIPEDIDNLLETLKPGAEAKADNVNIYNPTTGERGTIDQNREPIPPGFQLAPAEGAPDPEGTNPARLRFVQARDAGELPSGVTTFAQFREWEAGLEPGTTVNVAGPDMGPILDFVSKEEAAKANAKITSINSSITSLQDLIEITNSPDAAQLFGLGGTAAKFSAPIAEFLGFEKAFGFFGPEVKTIGDARNKAATALADAARTLLNDDSGQLSKPEQQLAGRILGDPEAILTGPTQIRQAATNLLSKLQFLQGRTVASRTAGGVQPQEGSVALDAQTKARVHKRAKEILLKAGKTEKTATPADYDAAVAKARLEIVGQGGVE
jgi:hypothetical protein